MKGFVCDVCGFISIEETMPEKCPVCGAPKTAFNEKANAIKTVGNAVTYGESEKKHIPAITVSPCAGAPDGCVNIAIMVGDIIHPMLPEHYIMRIDCYINNAYVSRVMLTARTLHPSAVLRLNAGSGKFSAIASCNLHGSWIRETVI